MLNGRFAAASALSSAAFFSLVVLPAAAFAQDAPPAQNAQAPATPPPADTTNEAPATGADIVVTGSRIRRPNLESPAPVTTIQGDEFFHTGATSIGDVLNQLPALTSTFSQSNSTRFLGTAGLNLLDLRGLGPQRTLVLVNGRRHVAGDILNEAVSPDVNTIPTDLVERVDVITGGEAAIYGSDAIAGVVNFILKDHFDGLEARGQGGVSQHGDAPSYFASVLAGKNFADGRGNIAVNLEYSHQGAFYASDRPEYSVNNNFVTVDSTPNDGVFNRVFTHDIRSASYSNGGTFLGNDCDGYYCSYHFTPTSELIPATGQRIGIAPFGSFVGGNGDNFRDGTQLGLRPLQDRYSANLIGHFEISPALVPFVEAKFVRSEVLGSASGPFFFNGGVTGSDREVFYTDNPYLSSQASSFLNDYYGAAPGDHQPFYFNENATSLTNRQERIRRDTYRIVGGLRGTFNEDWHYEVSANYGEFDERNEILGNVNLQRWLLSIDPVDQGQFSTGTPNGHIVCRATVDPSARIALETAADPAYAQAQLANDVAQCVPVNLFGINNVSDAAKGYLLQNSVANGKITQLVLNGYMSGDTSKWFSLPGGPLGFAVGAEYRKETASYREDDATKAGLTFYNAIPDFNAPAFEVTELFGEVQLPLLKDLPFAHDLTISGAGRYANYKGDAGSVWAYNANAEWSPVRDVRFRFNYARAVRAPTLIDLYSPLGQNYSLVGDPCSAENIQLGSQSRAANCAAAGVPAGFSHQYINSLGFLSGGNPKLKVENSDSFTVGAVIQPRWVPGLSLTVDWFDITVNDTIESLDAQTVLNSCYDLPDISNQYCSQFARYNGAAGTTGPRGEIPGQILENSLQVVPLNYAKLKVRGIDVEANYQHKFDFVGLQTRVIYTHNFKNDEYLDPTNPNFRDQLLGSLGYPFDEFTWNLNLNKGPVTFGYKMQYIGPMTVGPWDATHAVDGRPPAESDYSDIAYYPSTVLHNIRVQVDVGKKYDMYLGVDNLADKLPPLGLTGAGFGSGIYDNVGRFIYVGFEAKF